MLSSRTKQFLRISGINFITTGILLIGPAAIYRLYTIVNSTLAKTTSQTKDIRANYPTYPNKKFSRELLGEFSKLPTDYKSYLGWRRRKVDFQYTNIAGPYNARNSSGGSLRNSVWFFGGSTIWGTGASDNQTIPSHFNSITQKSVYNFGESGWQSRQSLNQLINAIGDNHKPSIVVFYDGVNDVYNQCRSENKSIPSHSREAKIKELIKGKAISERIIGFLLSPYAALARKLNFNHSLVNSGGSIEFDCDTNKSKARLVAQHLITNWRAAQAIARLSDSSFYGILQPTLFSTKTNSEYLAPSKVKYYPAIKRQYDAVYPLIIKEISRLCDINKEDCIHIIDGTEWLNGNLDIFIDFCHVNSLGNKKIAERLASLIKENPQP